MGRIENKEDPFRTYRCGVDRMEEAYILYTHLGYSMKKVGEIMGLTTPSVGQYIQKYKARYPWAV